ncbi:MAG: RNA polymerase sigma factor [Opitutales bacterium]
MRRDRRQILTEYLVLQARDGVASAFRELFELWHGPLTGFARARLGDPQAAEDVLQEAWPQIARALTRLHDPATFPAWAHRIVARRATDWIRREARARRRQSALEAEPEIAQPAALEPSQERRDEHAAVRAALAELPPEQREILQLFYISELGVATIATTLGIPRGTVKSRLFHARQRLRRRLAEDFSEPPKGVDHEQSR